MSLYISDRIFKSIINKVKHFSSCYLLIFFFFYYQFDIETFESAFSDLSYLEGKLGGKSINESAGTSRTAQARYPKPKLKELKPVRFIRTLFFYVSISFSSQSCHFNGANVDFLNMDGYH